MPPTEGHLPQGADALDGFNKREPLQSRLACPDEGSDLISLTLTDGPVRNPVLAAAIQVMLDTHA